MSKGFIEYLSNSGTNTPPQVTKIGVANESKAKGFLAYIDEPNNPVIIPSKIKDSQPEGFLSYTNEKSLDEKIKIQRINKDTQSPIKGFLEFVHDKDEYVPITKIK